jgi:hypothetical protein
MSVSTFAGRLLDFVDKPGLCLTTHELGTESKYADCARKR